MHVGLKLLVGCGMLMAAEAAVLPSSAPALIPAVRCGGGVRFVCRRDGTSFLPCEQGACTASRS